MSSTYQQKTWHRHLLEKQLEENKDLVRGKILDIGSKNRRYDRLFKGEVTAIDLNPHPEQNIFPGDIEKGLNFPDQSFDSVLCLEVFEYLENYHQAIAEIYRLMHPGGWALISIPFMYHEHGDKMRFTKGYLPTQFTKFSSVEIKTIGNAYTTIWDILRKKWLLGKKGWPGKLIGVFVLWPLRLLWKNFEQMEDGYYSGLFIILQK